MKVRDIFKGVLWFVVISMGLGLAGGQFRDDGIGGVDLTLYAFIGFVASLVALLQVNKHLP